MADIHLLKNALQPLKNIKYRIQNQLHYSISSTPPDVETSGYVSVVC